MPVAAKLAEQGVVGNGVFEGLQSVIITTATPQTLASYTESRHDVRMPEDCDTDGPCHPYRGAIGTVRGVLADPVSRSHP